jgi:predicted ATPase/DNA-binding winged helix-turn-helix (wHTH) protein
MQPGPELPPRITFGRFCLMPHRRELLLDDQPIRLGGRAFDVLVALIEARGSVVGKDALLARAWPHQIVEENNLEVQISALRAAFGAERALIRTVSRRGYQFTGEIRFPAEAKETPVDAGWEATASATNLPQPVSELIGRDDSVTEILRLAAAQRLVTLTGPGGIGKTRLAVAAAHRLLPQIDGRVWLAELAPISDPDLVPAAVAAAAGLELAAGAITAERVAKALTGKPLLLVLDNCEHLIDAAAIVAEALLRATPAARIIATSREPMRTDGEQVYPVPPLAVPAANIDDEADLLEYGAVRLFIERVRAADPQFDPDARPMVTLAAICRRLDGIPLAIELAAARAATLGIEEVAVRLDERLDLLTRGRRTALPRHQTLRATLDWSHELLAEPERVLFRRLAIFAGWFSLGAACAVAASLELPASDVIDGVSSLTAKSLVATEISGVVRYRLLETTRAYAIEKLVESGERETVARRHAEFYLDLFEKAETDSTARPAADWLADYAPEIDNLRAALDWAFAPGGDGSIGVALTAAAIPLWMRMSLPEECRGRAARALAILAAKVSGQVRHEMKLQVALAASLIYSRGPASAEIGMAYTRALEIAQRLDNPEYQLRALRGLWVYQTVNSRHAAALELAQRFYALGAARPDPNDRLGGEAMIGISQYYRGDLPSARRHLEHGLAGYTTPDQDSHLIRFQTDQRAWMSVFLARVLLLQGFPDQAMRTVRSAVEDARPANHAMSLCEALANGACLALLTGDLTAAEHYGAMLLDHSTRHALTQWLACGRSLQGVLVIHRGDVAAGLRLLRTAFDEFDARYPGFRLTALLMAEALGRAGQNDDGLAAIEEAIASAERTGEHWAMAEFVRVKGELLLLQAGPEASATAEDHFRQALDWARRQAALSWELRAATSLAQLLRDQGRSSDALACLRQIYGRFTEGFATADLRAAKALLDDLQELEEVGVT